MALKSLLSAAVAAFAVMASAEPLRHTAQSVAPLLASYDSEVIPENYIVVFKDTVKPTMAAFATHFDWLHSSIAEANLNAGNSDVNRIKHVYQEGVVGYAGQFEPAVLDLIRKSDEVAYVEKDSIVYASDTQKSAPWGLARISHRDPLTFSSFNKYVHDPNGGEGVTVYVVDTGINIEHVDFEGRAEWGKTVPQGDIDIDGNGHGTHVAGTIAGKRFGVAKKAHVKAVKVLGTNGSGSMSDVVKGVEFTVIDHRKTKQQAEREGRAFRGSVANMSLGGGMSRALNMAVDAAVVAGVHFAVAAGNDNRDACNYSPASAANAITVGASTIIDERAYFSNWGKCVDVFAPGKDILSTWIGSKYQTNTISGTSMASPHVAGLAAYLLSQGNESLTGAELKKRIAKLATSGVIKNAGNESPNLLIYNDPPKSFF